MINVELALGVSGIEFGIILGPPGPMVPGILISLLISRRDAPIMWNGMPRTTLEIQKKFIIKLF
jgi:hypothetical protein